MRDNGCQEVKKILDWYIESEEDRHEILGLMDEDIDPRIYAKNLKYFLEHSMDTMVLFTILRGRWADRGISEIVIRAVIKFVIKKWDEDSLEEIAWDIADGVDQYILQGIED